MHTGDIAIIDEKSYLKIVDRNKDMIIVSVIKVFSAKLEYPLTKHPAIGMVATVGVPNPDRSGSELVKALIKWILLINMIEMRPFKGKYHCFCKGKLLFLRSAKNG